MNTRNEQKQAASTYLRPEIEIIEMETEGVIAASGGVGGSGSDIPFTRSYHNPNDAKAIEDFIESF